MSLRVACECVLPDVSEDVLVVECPGCGARYEAGRADWRYLGGERGAREWDGALADLSDGALDALLAAAGLERGRRPSAAPGPEAPVLDEPAARALSVSSRAYRVLDERLPCALWGDTTERAVTVRDLCACTELDLFKLRGCGVTTLRAIKAALAEHGLALAPGRWTAP